MSRPQWLCIASHELRTPLTTMIGYTEMLLEDLTFSEGSREMLKGISKGTKRLHDIVDSMFDLAQLDMRTMQMHEAPVDIAPLPKVKADPNLLEKLFQHLLANAIKFTPNNGKVTVTAKALLHTVELPEGALQVTVSDTGVGVNPDSREIIFSKFYQPGELSKHSTSKTRFKGSGAGLGLALSKGIVEAHGGRIWVESKGYDEVNFPGSKFHVVLPLSNSSKNGETAPMGMEVNA